MKTTVLDLLTGHGPAIPVLALATVAALVFVVTARLARHADTLAEHTGLGRVWIGSVLLAATTSLPGLLTNVNAGLLDEPDIGAGDLLGASLANMLILAVLDIVFARRRILHQVAIDQTLVGLLGILPAAMVGTALVTGGWGRSATWASRARRSGSEPSTSPPATCSAVSPSTCSCSCSWMPPIETGRCCKPSPGITC